MNFNITISKIAFYNAKKSDSSKLTDKLITFFDGSDYSHVEMIIDCKENNKSISSSLRDGGVRIKEGINFSNPKWEIIELKEPVVFNIYKLFYHKNRLQGYDLIGLLGTKFPFIKGNSSKWFCSELVAYVLNYKCPSSYGLKKLYKKLSTL